jgi:hypothetical protein
MAGFESLKEEECSDRYPVGMAGRTRRAREVMPAAMRALLRARVAVGMRDMVATLA